MWHWQNREPLKEREFFPFAQEALVQLPHWPDHLARCDRKWGISFEIPSFADHPSLLFTPSVDGPGSHLRNAAPAAAISPTARPAASNHGRPMGKPGGKPWERDAACPDRRRVRGETPRQTRVMCRRYDWWNERQRTRRGSQRNRSGNTNAPAAAISPTARPAASNHGKPMGKPSGEPRERDATCPDRRRVRGETPRQTRVMCRRYDWWSERQRTRRGSQRTRSGNQPGSTARGFEPRRTNGETQRRTMGTRRSLP
jgi:hypothetical protein